MLSQSTGKQINTLSRCFALYKTKYLSFQGQSVLGILCFFLWKVLPQFSLLILLKTDIA